MFIESIYSCSFRSSGTGSGIRLECFVTKFVRGLQKLPKIGRPRDITFWRVEQTGRKPHVKSWITNLTHIKGQDVLIVPAKLRFDETSQFSEGSTNVSVTTFLSGLQKLPKIWRLGDITLCWKPHVKYWITNLTHMKEQDGLLIVTVKIRFDQAYQLAAGLANAPVTTFLGSLQKRPKIGRPCDITFWRAG